jgi:hypothetical protein
MVRRRVLEVRRACCQPPTRNATTPCSPGMEPELSDADLVAMLDGESTDEREAALGGEEDLWPNADQLWDDAPPSVSLSRLEGARGPHITNESAPPRRRWLSTVLAFAFALLLALTVALIERGSAGVGGVPAPAKATERVSSLSTKAAQVRPTASGSSHRAGRSARVRQRQRPSSRAQLSTSRPQAVAPAVPPPPAQRASREATQAVPSPASAVPPPDGNPGCEAPGDLGC